MDKKGVMWARIDDKRLQEMKFSHLDRLNLFDGDYAVCNEFVTRKHETIENVIKIQNEREEFLKAEKKYEEKLEAFMEKALDGEVNINLKDVNEELFLDSDSMNAFWKASYEIYLKQMRG